VAVLLLATVENGVKQRCNGEGTYKMVPAIFTEPAGEAESEH